MSDKPAFEIVACRVLIGVLLVIIALALSCLVRDVEQTQRERWVPGEEAVPSTDGVTTGGIAFSRSDGKTVTAVDLFELAEDVAGHQQWLSNLDRVTDAYTSVTLMLLRENRDLLSETSDLIRRMNEQGLIVINLCRDVARLEERMLLLGGRE